MNVVSSHAHSFKSEISPLGGVLDGGELTRSHHGMVDAMSPD
jgi:hypothetical protein